MMFWMYRVLRERKSGNHFDVEELEMMVKHQQSKIDDFDWEQWFVIVIENEGGLPLLT